mgnify:CR=1 FL=1
MQRGKSFSLALRTNIYAGNAPGRDQKKEEGIELEMITEISVVIVAGVQADVILVAEIAVDMIEVMVGHSTVEIGEEIEEIEEAEISADQIGLTETGLTETDQTGIEEMSAAEMIEATEERNVEEEDLMIGDLGMKNPETNEETKIDTRRREETEVCFFLRGPLDTFYFSKRLFRSRDQPKPANRKRI